MSSRRRTAVLAGVAVLLALILLAVMLDDGSDRPHHRHSTVAKQETTPNDDDDDPEKRKSLLQGWKLPEGTEAGDESTKAEARGEDDAPAADDAPDPNEAEPDEDDAAKTANALTNDPKLGEGRITGRVTHSGPLPEPEQIDMAKDPNCVRFAPEEARIRRRIVRSKDGGLAGAVVWVDGITAKYPPPAEAVPFEIRNCRYPPVVAFQTQQTLQITNADPTLHNVHAFFDHEFNQAMPKQGMTLEKRVKRAQQNARIADEVHPWQESRAFVFDHPFFAITDADGRFAIEHLPGDGPWTITIQHPVLGTKQLAADGQSEVLVHFDGGDG